MTMLFCFMFVSSLCDVFLWWFAVRLWHLDNKHSRLPADKGRKSCIYSYRNKCCLLETEKQSCVFLPPLPPLLLASSSVRREE